VIPVLRIKFMEVVHQSPAVIAETGEVAKQPFGVESEFHLSKLM
jgi:hypothetical protein